MKIPFFRVNHIVLDGDIHNLDGSHIKIRKILSEMSLFIGQLWENKYLS